MAKAFRYLTDIPIFASLTEEEGQLLLSQAARKKFPPRSYILMEGQPVMFFGIITRGSAKAILHREDDGELLLDLYRPGDFFGELNLSELESSPVSIMAVDSCELILASREVMVKLIQQNGTFAFDFMSTLCHKVHRLQNRLRDTVYLRGEDRVMAYLEDMADVIGIKVDGGRVIPEKLSHQVIGDSCGFSRETVTRLLKSLADDDLVLRTDDGWFVADA